MNENHLMHPPLLRAIALYVIVSLNNKVCSCCLQTSIAHTLPHTPRFLLCLHQIAYQKPIRCMPDGCMPLPSQSFLHEQNIQVPWWRMQGAELSMLCVLDASGLPGRDAAIRSGVPRLRPPGLPADAAARVPQCPAALHLTREYRHIALASQYSQQQRCVMCMACAVPSASGRDHERQVLATCAFHHNCAKALTVFLNGYGRLDRKELFITSSKESEGRM